MIQRLMERVYFTSAADVEFLLRELRTPELLIDLVQQQPEAAAMSSRRPVQAAMVGDIEAVEKALRDEEDLERARDRAYWAPLKRELEQLRRSR